MKKFLYLFISLIFIFVIDFLLGKINNIDIIRSKYNKFNSEISNLNIKTNNFIPNINHLYDLDDKKSQLYDKDKVHVFRTDNKGLILPYEIFPENFNVLFLGGSTTESNEVNENYRFPFMIQKNLKERNVNVNIINMGLRGHTSIDSINSLINRKELRKADIIFFMHNINDRLFLSVKNNYFADLGKVSEGSILSIKISFFDFINNVKEFFIKNSNISFILQQIYYNFTDNQYLDGSEIEFPDSDFLNSQKLYKQNLLIFINLAKSIDAIPIFLTQPLGFSSDQQKIFNDVMITTAMENNIDVIDLASDKKISNNESFLSDNIHLNKNGSTLISYKISDYLFKYLNKEKQTNQKNIERQIDNINKCLNNNNNNEFTFKLFKNARYPSFSNDGKWILLQEENQRGENKIRLIDVKNKKSHYIEHAFLNNTERHPTFFQSSNNKVSILFGMQKGDIEEIYKIEWPSLSLGKLINKKINGSIPSTNDNLVYFPSNFHNQVNPDLYYFNSKNNEIAQLTKTSWEEWRPISDNNKNIYFISNKENNFDIYKLNILTNNIEIVYSSPFDEWDPALSYDNNFLLFASKANNNWDIFLMNLINQEVEQLTNESADDWDPSFHPSGRLFLYASFKDGMSSVYARCIIN